MRTHSSKLLEKLQKVQETNDFSIVPVYDGPLSEAGKKLVEMSDGYISSLTSRLENTPIDWVLAGNFLRIKNFQEDWQITIVWDGAGKNGSGRIINRVLSKGLPRLDRTILNNLFSGNTGNKAFAPNFYGENSLKNYTTNLKDYKALPLRESNLPSYRTDIQTLNSVLNGIVFGRKS